MKLALSVIILLLICYLSYSTKSVKPVRKIASIEQGSFDFVAESQSIIDLVSTREINPDTCEKELDRLVSDYQLLSPQNLDLASLKQIGQLALNKSFEARLALHSMLKILPKACKLKLKELNLLIRASEDYIGVHFYADPQISAENIQFANEATPIFSASAYHPFHLGSGIDPKEKFEFKNGDIMITKGVSFVSSTISEITHPGSLFSHIVFVHVDQTSKEVTTIESYVGKGVGIYKIAEALKNENARILVLRAKDTDLASKAADYMYNKVIELKKKNKFIPYDYQLDFSDNSKLSCEEVAFDSFKQVSNGQLLIPEVMSEVTLKDEKFLNRIGIKKGSIMVPSDLETDSRFDIALDWTDYRLIRDSWRKDAVLGEVFRWIQEHDYTIHEDLSSLAARGIWSTRNVPGVWGMLASISGIPKEFTNDVPSVTISTMASLKKIGSILLPEIFQVDREYFEKNGKWMTSEMLRESLENFILSEPKNLRKVFRESH
jgi:hypothetical protein